MISTYSLSAREIQVLIEIRRGKRNLEIANALGIVTSTVKFHVRHIFEKLGASTRAEAVYRATHWGIFDDKSHEGRTAPTMTTPISTETTTDLGAGAVTTPNYALLYVRYADAMKKWEDADEDGRAELMEPFYDLVHRWAPSEPPSYAINPFQYFVNEFEYDLRESALAAQSEAPPKRDDVAPGAFVTSQLLADTLYELANGGECVSCCIGGAECEGVSCPRFRAFALLAQFDAQPKQDDAAPGIRELQRQAFETAREKGFHEGLNPAGRDGLLVRFALVHTEVSEATQIVKRHWSDNPNPVHVADVTEECADVIIRLFDLAQGIGGDLEAAVLAKMAKNQAREYRYGTPDAKGAE